MQTNIIQEVALTNSRTHSKNYAKQEQRQSLVQLPFMTSGQETERVYY